MGVTAHADGPLAFPHPLSERVVFQVARPRPVAPQRLAAQQAARNARILRRVLRGILFYLTTATLIVVGVGVHEYSHYAAHEGFGVPHIAYSDSVHQAQSDILEVQRSRGATGDVLIQQPRATTIVFFPNTFLQAAGLGLLPGEAYQDKGVLASTFFHLDNAQVNGVQARGGEMPTAVVAAPLLVAGVVFVFALAWTLWRPNLFNKALLVAYAVQLGDAGHHASAFGMAPEMFYLLSTVVFMVTALLVGLRMVRKEAPKTAKAAKRIVPDMRPATRVIVRATPTKAQGATLSVRATTDNSRTQRASKPVPARMPVTWT